jgi:D-apionate oxidoisomerase
MDRIGDALPPPVASPGERRISNNLAKSDYRVLYCDNSPHGRELITGLGREPTDTDEAVAQSDVVILAVPDVVLGKVSAGVVPAMNPGAILLTLDPAAVYANLLYRHDDIAYAVAHPCHPFVFLERTTKEEHADTFGGIAAPQDVVAAFENGSADVRDLVEDVVRVSYGPVLDVHWVTVKQFAVPEPTVVETIACMVGGLLKEALHETMHTVGVPEPAAKAMLFGHVQVALANTLRGSNPFSDACLIAMDYGRESIVRHDWKKIFDDGELDKVLARMLHLDQIERTPA